MYSLSSPLTLKGPLKLNTTVLLVILFALYITSCEARHLGVNGKYSSKKPPLPCKDVTEVGATKKRLDFAFGLRVVFLTQVGGMVDESMGADVLVKVKKEVASSGGVRSTRPAVRVLQQLPHRKHKDGDSSRHSLRRRFEGTEVRSGARERSMLGVESNREQVGSNATTAYAAETLVAMDYPIAHPAPAIHNR